jgi:Putative MetA-pathway of phenol degradation
MTLPSTLQRVVVARIVAALVVAGALLPREASAQMPARFYLKPLANARAVPLIVDSISGNTNPFDPSHTVNSSADVQAFIAMAGYAHVLPLFGRAAMAAVIVPVGRISGDVTVDGNIFTESADGFGDPMLEFNVNLIGPKAQTNLPAVLRYEPKFSLDFLGDVAFPIGEYDDDRPLNIGQHRWYGRLGLPVIGQLGPWVPGRRTTVELLPAVWFFGENDDYVGHTLQTDPMFQLDFHLTRDFTEHFWGALDASWYVGGKASIDGVEGEMLNNVGVGFTLGYGINDNLNLTVGYKTTIADRDADDMRMSGFMVSLVFGWHPLLEGAKRLQGK